MTTNKNTSTEDKKEQATLHDGMVHAVEVLVLIFGFIIGVTFIYPLMKNPKITPFRYAEAPVSIKMAQK